MGRDTGSRMQKSRDTGVMNFPEGLSWFPETITTELRKGVRDTGIRMREGEGYWS